MEKDFYDIVDYYIYNNYLNYKRNFLEKNKASLTIPFFYFKNCFLNYIKKKLNIKKNFNIYNFIKQNNEKYLFLFEKDGNLRNPEFLNIEELNIIKSILNNNENDFYALCAYTSYYYNKGNFDLDVYFERLLKIEKNNPFILIRLARYQASALYKISRDKKYLYLGRDNIILAIKQFKNKREVPTFFYSWLGYIEHELGNYCNAIKLYDKVILLNKKLGVEVPEPYVWKIFSLNKLGFYNESLKLSEWFLENNLINKDNDKRDFRFYKILCDNYYHISKYEYFVKYLELTIKKFLEFSDFNISGFGNKFKLNFENTNLHFGDNFVLRNKYDSFFEYNKKYIKSDLYNIIFSIIFLYKEKLLGEKIYFLDSRGIEILCFNYLKYIYGGK